MVDGLCSFTTSCFMGFVPVIRTGNRPSFGFWHLIFRGEPLHYMQTRSFRQKVLVALEFTGKQEDPEKHDRYPLFLIMCILPSRRHYGITYQSDKDSQQENAHFITLPCIAGELLVQMC